MVSLRPSTVPLRSSTVPLRSSTVPLRSSTPLFVLAHVLLHRVRSHSLQTVRHLVEAELVGALGPYLHCLFQDQRPARRQLSGWHSTMRVVGVVVVQVVLVGVLVVVAAEEEVEAVAVPACCSWRGNKSGLPALADQVRSSLPRPLGVRALLAGTQFRRICTIPSTMPQCTTTRLLITLKTTVLPLYSLQTSVFFFQRQATCSGLSLYSLQLLTFLFFLCRFLQRICLCSSAC